MDDTLLTIDNMQHGPFNTTLNVKKGQVYPAPPRSSNFIIEVNWRNLLAANKEKVFRGVPGCTNRTYDKGGFIGGIDITARIGLSVAGTPR